MKWRIDVSACLFALLLTAYSAAQQAGNSIESYRQLHTQSVGSDAVSISDYVLHRDAATFTLTKGTVAFSGEVNGKITMAVFRGRGHLHITPPTAEEKRSLKLLNKTEEFDEDFDQAV
ncbi:MAG: hypothetical protein FWD64_07970, partial [Acidobacteriaceae bacterium]|nr:hypothetical protein [Acidobacteriaceae bacterium]